MVELIDSYEHFQPSKCPNKTFWNSEQILQKPYMFDPERMQPFFLCVDLTTATRQYAACVRQRQDASETVTFI